MSFEAINPFTFKVIIDREGLTIATFFTIFCILALLSLVYTLKSSFEFHSFFCSDIFRFLSHLFCIFYRYFLCGYHVVYIKHLTVITIYAKLIKNKLPSHTYTLQFYFPYTLYVTDFVSYIFLYCASINICLQVDFFILLSFLYKN